MPNTASGIKYVVRKLFIRLRMELSYKDLTCIIRCFSNKWIRKKKKEKEEMAKEDREEDRSGEVLPFTLLISS